MISILGCKNKNYHFIVIDTFNQGSNPVFITLESEERAQIT